MEFEIGITTGQDYIKFMLNGDLDMYSEKALSKCKSKSKEYKNVSIDLSNLDFVDSTGVRGLIELIEDLTNQKKSVKVLNIKPELEELFDLLDIYDLLGREIFES